eukprot:m.38320 g.38320  ORF g.38320 m.38320 type:complete len:1021 (-) comp11478_c0_seq1:708-3770(-)
MAPCSVRGGDRAAGHHAHQMRAVFGRAVQIADHLIGRGRQPGKRVCREVRRQRRLGLAPAEDAVLRGAGDRHPHAVRVLRDEGAGQGKARGGLGEFRIGRLLRDRETHRGDDLALVERSGEHPLEEVVRRDLALVGDDGRARGQRRRGVAGRRVVIGQRAADRAAVAHHRVADLAGQFRQRRVIGGGVPRHDRMRRGRADDQHVAVAADAFQRVDPGQRNQRRGRVQALFHRGQQGHAARERLRLVAAERGDRVFDRGGFDEVEIIHPDLLLLGVHRRPDARGRSGHVDMGDVGMAAALKRVDDRVDDGGRAADGPGLAAALHAQRVVGAGGDAGMIDRVVRQIVRARHGVIHIRARDELPVLVIDTAFQKRLTDPLRDAAMDLAFDDHRVHHIAEIVGRGEGEDLDLAGLGVDLDLAAIGARGIGEVGRIVEGRLFQPRLHGFEGVVMRHIGRQRDARPVHRLVGARDGELAVGQLDIRFRGFKQVSRDLLGLVDHLVGGLDQSRAAHGQRARPIGAHAHRRVGGVAVVDLDLARIDADHLGHDLGEGGLVPLTVRMRAGIDADRAGCVDPHGGGFVKTGAGAQLSDEVRRRDAAGLDVMGDAEAAQLAAFLRFLGPGGEARVIRDLEHLVHRRVVIPGIVFDRHGGGIGELIGLDEVLTPQLDRIDAQLARGFVDDPFQLERGLGAAGAAIGIDRHGVGKHRLHVHIDERRAVIAGHQRAVQPGRDRGREGRQIGAHIGVGLGADRGEVVRVIERQLDLRHVVAAMRIRDEGFRPRRGPFHRALQLTRGEGAEGFLGIVEDLGAETAAHIGRDDAQLVLGDPQHEGAHQKADHMRVLRGGIKRGIVVPGIVIAHRHARLHRVGDEPLVDQFQRGDMGGLGEGLVHGGLVFLDEAPVVAQVGRQVVMHLGRALGQRGLHVDDGGQVLDIELDRLGGVTRLFQRLGDDHGDGIADMAHLALGEDRMLGLLHRLAVFVGDLPAAGHAAHALEILRGEDADHAVHGFGGRGVDAVDLAVGNL